MSAPLNTEEILAGIRAWVEIESPTDVPEAMARIVDRVQADYQAIGATVERIAGRDGFGDHLLVTDARHCPPAAAYGPGILILSHLDTVHPLGTLTGALPFRVEGDFAFGPGIADMKSGAHLALAALRQMTREHLATALPVRHLLVSDEEMGSRSSRALIEREGRRSKFVLVTEPARSGGKVVTARKGVANFVVRAHGRPSHAGVEHDKGRSAIREIARQIVDLEAMTDYARELTVNVGLVRGGTRPNVVAEHAEIEVDVRMPNAAIGDEIVARIRALQAYDPDVTLAVEGGINRPGFEKTPPIAALFEHARALAEPLGIDLRDLKTGGGSDGNFTAALAPTLDGLGADGEGAHTLAERIFVSSIVPRTRLLMRLLETLR